MSEKATPHEQPRRVREESTFTVSAGIAAAASARRALSAAVRVGKTAMLRTSVTVLSFFFLNVNICPYLSYSDAGEKKA